MSYLQSEQQQSVREFADRHFERFVQWGGQLLNRKVVAVVTGPGSGNVLWDDAHQGLLTGHRVGSIAYDQFDVERFEQFGFTESEQREKLWTIKPSRYDPGRQEIPHGKDHAFAQWGEEGWKVVRSDDSQPVAGEVSGWASPSSHLTEREQASLQRVVQETEVMLDAALTLGENSSHYYALEDQLTQRATGDEKEAIDILMAPWRPQHALSHRLQSSVHQLANNAPALARALAGKSTRDSTDANFLYPVSSDPLTHDPTNIRLHENTLLPPFPQAWTIFDIPRPD